MRQLAQGCGKKIAVLELPHMVEAHLADSDETAKAPQNVLLSDLIVPASGQRASHGTFLSASPGLFAHAENLREPFSGDVECDETTFGGNRKGKRGWGAAGKVIVFGIVKRNGMVRAFPLQGRKQAEMIRFVREHTKPGSLYYTDQWQAYASLRLVGEHVVVRKEQGRPKGRDHVNGIEGFWSYTKNWLYPF